MGKIIPRRINLQPFRNFVRSETNSGLLLLSCVVFSMIIANTPLAPFTDKILNAPLHVSGGDANTSMRVIDFINDGLMAVFFLLVGLEIKRELIEGELSSPRQAALPVFAAVGGMVVPALLFALFNHNADTRSGWGIPMATDIAFAIAILSLLGKKTPTAVKVFLVGLAIADDLGAILVIALFYTREVHIDFLLFGAICFAVQILLNRFGCKRILLYILPGILLWYFIHHSGIHATVAGVLTAFTLPTNPVSKTSPLERLEHILYTPVNFIIMPLFALANTNIRFSSEMLDEFDSPLSIGVLLGLCIGKPLGIAFFSWLAVQCKLARIPRNTGWIQMIGIGCLGGIGFTMSIFISLLSFGDEQHQLAAKFVVICASLLSGLCGFLILYITGKKRLKRS